MLEHKPHIAFAYMHIGRVFAAEMDGAHVGRFQARDDAQERGLAAARRAEERNEFAGGNVQAHIAQRLKVAKLFADVTDFDAHGVVPCEGRSGGSSAAAFKACSLRCSAIVLMTSVTRANRANSEAAANAATDWYSL